MFRTINNVLVITYSTLMIVTNISMIICDIGLIVIANSLLLIGLNSSSESIRYLLNKLCDP